MMTPAGIPFLAPADSALAVTTVYTASLLATLPAVLAGAAALLLRKASAQARVLVWRSAIAALLLVFVGRLLPLHWMAWVVPSTLAAPLVALGRVQVTQGPGLRGGDGTPIAVILFVYLAGVALVLIPTAAAVLRMRRIASRGRVLTGEAWAAAIASAKVVAGVRRDVRVIEASVAVPMTWGWRTPVIALPIGAGEWSGDHRAVVLRHELMHVASGDWPFAIAARLGCALFWFHPGAWWIAAALRDECELACDERVVASGIRRSDYAEALLEASSRFLSPGPALALSRRRGLRARLAAVLDTGRDLRAPARGWIAVAAASTLLVAGPMSAVQLAPTRDVLTTLVRDSRWESRAYAVIGLAQRADADSVAVARAIAERDPNPRVRAWARYALRQGDAAQLRAVLHP